MFYGHGTRAWLALVLRRCGSCEPGVTLREMTIVDQFLDRIGRLIAERLETPSSGYEPFTPSDPGTLRCVLEVGDVLLVEGHQKVGAAIKYLTHSTWSHAALYVGNLVAAAGVRANIACSWGQISALA